MPNRIIKESINESFGLSECSLFAEDLFKRLITYADDYGRFNSDTQIMRARLYPREYEFVSERDIVDALIELAGVGKIDFYSAKHFNQGGHDGVYGAFPNWNAHQRVRESKSRCPEPDDTEINDWYLRRFIPFDMKAEIIERDGFKCQICGKFVTTCRDAKRFVKLGSGLYHIDHIVPCVQGGRATLENLRLTCPECNLKRKKNFSFKEILDECENGVSPPVAAACGESRPESNPIQSESESNPNTSRASAFGAFWSAYPKKVGKGAAEKAFSKLSPSLLPQMLSAIDAQKQSDQWKKDGGQFIPNPATWLNQRRWEDELPAEGATEKGHSAFQELEFENYNDPVTGELKARIKGNA